MYDLQNPQHISFDSSSGPRQIDSSGVVEDWVLEEEEEETDSIDIASVSTEPLEEEQEGEEADDVENQQDVENMTDVESQQDVEDGEALDWDAPDYVPTWLASLPSTPPSRVAQQAGTLLSRVSKTKHLRRSKRLQQRKRNQQLTAPAPWR
jgi:hypothetical protein